MPLIDYFPKALALNPAGGVVPNAKADVYAASDTSLSNPLEITDMQGLPIEKLEASPDGIYPEFKVTDGTFQVLIVSGSLVTANNSLYWLVQATGLDPDTVQASIESASASANSASSAASSAAAAQTARTAAEDAAANIPVIENNDDITENLITTKGTKTERALSGAVAEQIALPGSAIQNAILALVGGITPPEPLLYGLRMMGAGDSIEGLGGNGSTLMGDSPSAYTSHIVGDRVRFCGVVQRSGNTAAQYVTNGLDDLRAAIAMFGVETVLVLLGTNDAGDSNFSASAYQAAMLTICDGIEAEGARPLLREIPVRGEPSASARVPTINNIIRAIAQQRGYAVLDYYTATDNGSGGWKTGYNTDQVHPSPLGVKAMVSETAAELREALLPADGFFATSTGADAGNLLSSRGFFTSGGGNGNTNVGAGFRLFSTAVTPSFQTVEGVPGRMQRLTVAGTGNRNMQSLDTIPVVAGHVFRFGCALQAVGFETEAAKAAGATYSLSVTFLDSAGATLGNSIGVVSAWESDLGLGWVNFAREAPAGSVSARMTLGISSGGQIGSYVQIGAVTFRDESVTAPATPTTTSLAVSPSGSAAAGATVTLTATVSPSSVSGTVHFRDGATILTDVATVDGVATFSSSELAEGAHSFTAVFQPSSPDYETSTSSAVAYTIGSSRTLFSLGSGNDDTIRRYYGPDIPGTDADSINVWPEAFGGTAFTGGSTRRATRQTSGGLTFARFTGDGASGALLDGAPLGPNSTFTVAFAFRLSAAYGSDFLDVDGYRIRRAGNGDMQITGAGGNVVVGAVSLGVWHTLSAVLSGTDTKFMLDTLADAGPGAITGPNASYASSFRFLVGATLPAGETLDIAVPSIWSGAKDRTHREAWRTAVTTQYPELLS